MAYTTRASLPDLLELKTKWAGFATDADYKRPTYPSEQLFRKMDSTKKDESFVDMSGYSTFTEIEELDEVSYDSRVAGTDMTLTHKSYSIGDMVSREMWEDMQWPILKEYAREFKVSEAESDEILRTTPFNVAFNTVCKDGQYFLDTDHPTDDGSTTWSNKLSSNAALSETSLAQARRNMKYTVDGRGKMLDFVPKFLVTGPDLVDTVRQLLKNPDRSGTANRDINTIYEDGFVHIVLPKLTSTTAWFLLTGDVSSLVHPLIWIDRNAYETEIKYEFDLNNAIKMRAWKRCITGSPYQRGWYGSTGA